MKKQVFFIKLLIGGLILSSCCFDGFDNAVSGNGNVISETRTVNDFHGISVAAGLKVFVNFGEMSNDIEVEADENLHEYINTRVDNGTLKIYTSRGIRNAKSKNIYINAGQIDRLRASSAGKLTGSNTLISDELNIDVSSAAEVNVSIEAEDLDINVSSSAILHIDGFAQKVEVDISSAASLDAKGLIVDICDIDASSAANAKINVKEKLNATASSAAHIRYAGNPETKNIKKSSAGSVSGN